MAPLPIDPVLPELIDALRKQPCAVLRAPTGAGKTTRVPPALLDAGLAGQGRILLLEPRRLAARAAARRMASERGGRLGDEVGYHVRFDRVCGRHTRILAVTPGILLRLLHDDPFLESAGIVLFDEFHERSLDNDLALGIVRLVQQTVRPDLRLVVMSATLAVETVSAYLGGCPIIVSDGRLFPVEILHEPRPLYRGVASAVEGLLDRTAGDLLVFLPGLTEIREVAHDLEFLARERDLAVMPLHGDLPPEQQDAALLPQPRRKIVLATNVAETSVTVEGVTGVVDTGVARTLVFDPGVGLDRLRLTPISRASADQRAGRAGRTQPGVCVRLWSTSAHRARPEQTEPEIRRVDLAGAVLQLLCLGETDVLHFPWLEAPRESTVEQALALLRRLGAVEPSGVTELGHTLARLPVHPRLGRLLIEGQRWGQPERVTLAAALLSERDPFRRSLEQSAGTQARQHATSSDVLDRVEALEEYERDGRTATPLGALHRGAARFILRARDQLLRSLRQETRRAALPEQSAAQRDWLPVDQVSSAIEVFFDAEAERVSARKRLRFEDLVLEEAPASLPEDEEVARVLAKAASKRLEHVLPADDSPAASFLMRVRCLRQWMPELELPAFEEAELREVLTWLCHGCRSFDELRKADWLQALQGRLTRMQQQAIEREAPERLPVPSGSRIALRYEVGRPPILAVRIQEVFGLGETPRIAGGRVRVLLHLLAPNYRPQQVTEDLASFWANTYPQVRKELRARYPKHAWPEDPVSAVPERHPRRKRTE
ncbi:MAG: DEAD/DEAH box helicase [Planctomycetes bacterium]|nr:DEAD/DEAH box helicase [Planctomycetota bacterium]